VVGGHGPLYERAVGYNYDAVKIFMPANAKKPVYAPYVEHISPDVIVRKPRNSRLAAVKIC